MRPDFALNLSHEGIELLHCSPGDIWTSVDEIALDDPGLVEKLTFLRKTAIALEGDRFTTKLFIPNTQILFTTVDAPGPSDAEREEQIRAALEGKTPYDVADLAFDWVAGDDAVQVAAVALETLDEAEQFAVEHQFNPISFVATSGNDSFGREINFGATAYASIAEVEEANIFADLVPTPAEEVTEPTIEDVPFVASRAEQDEPHTEGPLQLNQEEHGVPEIEDAAASAFTSSRQNVEASTTQSGLSRIKPRFAVDVPVIEIEAAPAEPEVEAEPTLSSTPHDGQLDPPPAFLASAREEYDRRSAPPIPDVAAPLPAAAASLTAEHPGESPAFVKAPLIDTDGSRTLARRVADVAKTTRLAPIPSGLPPAPVSDKSKTGLLAAVAILLIVIALAAFGTWRMFFTSDAPTPTISVVEPAPTFSPEELEVIPVNLPDGSVRPAPRPSDLTDAGFSTETPLSTLPELDLAAPLADQESPDDFAAMSENFANLPQTLATLPEAAEVPLVEEAVPEQFEVASLPDTATPVTEFTAQEIEDIRAAGLTPPTAEELAESIGIDQPGTMTAAEIAEAYAETNILQGLDIPAAPDVSQDIDDIFVAAIDRQIDANDAPALPTYADGPDDFRPASQLSPSAASVSYDLDENGFVKPTADGALTPDGIRIFAGRPALAPPVKPASIAALVIDPASKIRPTPRPDSLLILASIATDAPVVSIGPLVRPTARPVSAQADAATGDQTATELAILTSTHPSQRPSDFNKIVDKTRVLLVSVDPKEQQPQAGPILPTRASVAKTATIKNAIKAKKLNLIGVYGSASSRRALMRLPSGRFVKVEAGDRIDGGRVTAIGINTLNYVKNGKSYVLTIPS